MSIIDFMVEVLFLSASGVLFPGPLFLANLICGSRTGIRAGFKIALGHTVVEFPLIILIALSLFGFSSFIFTNQSLRIIGILGGAAIIYFSISQIYDITKRGTKTQYDNNDKYSPQHHRLDKKISLRGPFIIGVVFTALNPFFLVWWVTVGIKLVSDSISLFGVGLGVVFLFLLHIWMDYTWLGLTSYMINKGRSIIKTKFYFLFILSLSAILVSYGLYIILANTTLYLTSGIFLFDDKF
jgi:threonine/homoserine/homoserine lactone efflux protein